MSKLIILNLNRKEIATGDSSKTLLQHIHQAGIDWMFACGGKGRCTTCRIIVVEGLANISPRSNQEKKFLDAGRLKDNERLTCQCFCHGSVVGLVPESSKLPHLSYTK
jgi:ferredoxin, 2Fe-2S